MVSIAPAFACTSSPDIPSVTIYADNYSPPVNHSVLFNGYMICYHNTSKGQACVTVYFGDNTSNGPQCYAPSTVQDSYFSSHTYTRTGTFLAHAHVYSTDGGDTADSRYITIAVHS